MELIAFHPNMAVLTNEVSDTGITWPEYADVLANGGDLIPIIVSQVNRNLDPAYIVLDGNHRACLMAKYGRPIPAYVMTAETTADEILQMEDGNIIQRFPHRDFIAGEETYRQLIKRAIKAAFEVNETISQVMTRLQAPA